MAKIRLKKSNETETPPSGKADLYIKEDGKLYLRNDDGEESFVGGGATNFLDLTDTPSTYSGKANLILKVKSDETGIEFANDTDEKVKSDSGDTTAGYLEDKVDNNTIEVDTTNHVIKVKDNVFSLVGHTHAFIDLNDTPSAYSGQANKIVSVKSSEDGLEFIENLDEKVKADVNDATPDYLNNKIDGATLILDEDNHKIKVGTLGTDNISDNSITTSKIADLNITGSKIANNTISKDKLSFNISYEIVSTTTLNNMDYVQFSNLSLSEEYYYQFIEKGYGGTQAPDTSSYLQVLQDGSYLQGRWVQHFTRVGDNSVSSGEEGSTSNSTTIMRLGGSTNNDYPEQRSITLNMFYTGSKIVFSMNVSQRFTYASPNSYYTFQGAGFVVSSLSGTNVDVRINYPCNHGRITLLKVYV